MAKHIDTIVKKVEEKYKRRDKRKKTTMKVSGKNVMKLRDIIRKKM